ncbi:TetR family transcriptional regulator [Tomitella fengzijianii]|uniref:TetR/AcrR family transcriptional regulator n=1 Tax=Tomitella fengzijianii TaxID=2597660 RepID=A0A516X6W6_9ACTN|nr:TetR family transcriptional regulator [Tomitella fengzijianii]QDQ98805.1 TetR/AcrR family transcriptional regulator [Tomitella fengzijianii]
MPRVGEAREAAEPASADQRLRYRRILSAAAKLGSEKELERVQMNEVAREAGVAIATLYRYFPSKTHLFVRVMIDQIDRLNASAVRSAGPSASPQDRICEVLLQATRALLRRPTLGNSMILAVSAARAATIPDVSTVDRHFRDTILAAAGIDVERVTEREFVPVRVLMYAWFGLVQACLNGRLSVPDAESDIRVACRMLLSDLPAGSSEGF